MSVKVRPFKGKDGVWEVDIVVRCADGRVIRERRKAPVSGKTGAMRWGQERERFLLVRGLPAAPSPMQRSSPSDPTPSDTVPTLAEFAPQFIEGHYKAERRSPATLTTADVNLRLHLIPLLGDRRLDRIGAAEVALLKAKLQDKAASTVNVVLNTLRMLLKKAMEWQIIPRGELEVTRLRAPEPEEVEFYPADAVRRMVEAAASISAEAVACVLLAADAGLRRSEIVGLQWPFVDLERKIVTVAFRDYRGQLGPTKGKRKRRVHMTGRLCEALEACRHDRGAFVLMHADGRRFTEAAVEWRIRQAQWRAGFRSGARIREDHGKTHKLRHTCASLLAMRGAPTVAIKEILGHRDIKTTERYMHLAPQAASDAIRLLED